MKTLLIPAAWIMSGSMVAFAAQPLTESAFTEIIQEANVVTATNKAGTPAKTNDIFKVPDLVRTGRDSRVELTAKDQTITRIGSNTTFTFAQSGRDILLKSGGVLFHSPAGAGGGAIKHKGSSAAVLGTTEICQILPDGRFKVIDLEGHVEVSLVNGISVRLMAGQMVIVSPDGTKFSDVATFNLAELASHLLLVVGFSEPLSSRSLIDAAIEQQNQEIKNGSLSISVSWQEAGYGLDLVYTPMNDSLFYLNGLDIKWNPLDFPGGGPVGPTPGGPGGMPLIPLDVNLIVNPPLINPPPITNVDP